MTGITDSELGYTNTIKQADMTQIPMRGSTGWSGFPYRLYADPIVTDLCNKSSRIGNTTLGDRMTTFIEVLSSELDRAKIVQPLPKMFFDDSDDRGVYLEWIFDDFRIGFVISTEDRECGWFLVSKGSMGDSNVRGELLRNIRPVISHLVDVVHDYA